MNLHEIRPALTDAQLITLGLDDPTRGLEGRYQWAVRPRPGDRFYPFEFQMHAGYAWLPLSTEATRYWLERGRRLASIHRRLASIR